MTSLSQNVKNGQQLNVAAGAAAIAAGDLVEIGGQGTQAWPVGTIDYAVVPGAVAIKSAATAYSQALPGAYRQAVARDKLGNIYIAGTDGSGRLVIYKFNAIGTPLSSAILDATATSVNNAQMHQLSSGAFVCVYARATGALRFVVFDAMLSSIAGNAITTEFASTNVVYHASTALDGGGFAIAFQSGAGTAINFTTYNNAGQVVLATTSIQTLAGSATQEYLRLRQLSNGNLVCAFRGTMTAAAIAGTSFVVFTTSGAIVAGPVSVDNTSTLGFLEVSVLAGFFAVATANGTNLLAAVYNNAGAVQGSGFNVGNTLNSLAYPQTKLLNDGVSFWLVWFSSVGNGLYVISMNTAGLAPIFAASGLGSSTLTASTFALDADFVNGSIVCIAASSATAGQYFMSVGTPDASIGIQLPYLRTAPTVLGNAAATTGSNGPRVISSGSGLYLGSNPPTSQPTHSAYLGDFTAIFVYDQVNVASTFLAIQKLETSAILGTALDSVIANAPGTPLLVNPGPGEYPNNNLAGTSGTTFNHIGLPISGTAGAIYASGVGMTGLLNGPFDQVNGEAFGQCRLQYTSATSVQLAPFNGNNVKVNGKTFGLPSGGYTIQNTNVNVSGVGGQNLAASTVYLLFLWNNSLGSIVPDFWPLATGHVTDTSSANIGVEVRSNAGAPDSTRTLIGMVSTNGSSQFSSFLVISWFNQRDRVQRTNFTGNPQASLNGVLIELSTSIRNSFLVWGNANVAYTFTGTASINAANNVAVNTAGFDGTTPELEGGMYESFTTDTTGNVGFSGNKSGLTEGLHYATILGMFGQTGSGSPAIATWVGGTTPAPTSNPPAVLQVGIKG